MEISEISPFYDLYNRFSSYGFKVIEIDGHDFDDIFNAFSQKELNKGLIILANTIKGKGIKQLENNPSSHYVKINVETANKWKGDLI